MADEQPDSIANRDTPIPVVSVTGPDDSRPRTPENGSRHRLSPSKLKDKLESLGDKIDRHESPSRVSDRMFSMYSVFTSHV
jgi:hypothetical protein